MSTILSEQDLIDVVEGACLLGSGGGGSRSEGTTMVKALKDRKYPNIELVHPSEVADSSWGVVIAAIGSPFAGKSDVFTSASTLCTELMQKLAFQWKGPECTLTHLLPFEIGGVNSIMPVTACADLNIPLLDGDGNGRATPALNQCTYATVNGSGIPPCPFSLTNNPDVTQPNWEDNRVEIGMFEIKDAAVVDSLSREVVSSPLFGNVGAYGIYLQDGNTMRDVNAVIPGGVTLSRQAGAALREARATTNADYLAVVETVLAERGMYLLFQGEYQGQTNVTEGGFDHGTTTFKNGDDVATIVNQNENLLAWKTGKDTPMAMAPDSICFLALDGPAAGYGLSNPDLSDDMIGSTMAIIGIPAAHNIGAPDAPQMRSKEVIAAFAVTTQSMGYYGDFVPVEELANG